MSGIRDSVRGLSIALLGATTLAAGIALAQTDDAGQANSASHRDARDPGPRPDPKSPIPNHVAGLNSNEAALFVEGLLRISELEGTCDTCSQQPQNVQPIDPSPTNPLSPNGLTNSAGMGPVFNADQCFICHSQPQLGGSAPKKNPAMLIAHRLGATNIVPSFEAPNGPIRETRFKFNGDGSRDGGVHNLFTLQGRSDAPNCSLKQPDYPEELRRQNVAYRIPLQLFGLGLIESIQDKAIMENMHAFNTQKRMLGISGHVNRVANTGTIARFGWKAQNASINMFAGEAYNVEMGITNDLFPVSRSEDDDCMLSYEPFDVPRTDVNLYNNPLKIMPAWMMFTEFMRLLDAPRPVAFTDSARRGQQLFTDIGCALCHTPLFQTRGSANPVTPAEEIGPKVVALRGQTVNLYSDLLVHHMGASLADNIVQGNSGPDEFRTTPLWGLGQRLYFLHDGRTSDLSIAIRDHRSLAGSDGGDNPARDADSRRYGPSEANAVIDIFDEITPEERQSILDFLRSL